MRTMKVLVFIFSIFILIACQQESEPAPQHETNQEEIPGKVENEKPNDVNQETLDEVNLKEFFMEDGTEAEYKGEGNEYAQYTAKTQWLNDRFVNIYEDNGGTVVLRTFRVDDDKIVVVREEGESYDPYEPTNEELEKLEPQYTFLQVPLKEGETFDAWTVTDDALTVETPLKNFKNVIVIEKQDDDSTIRKYFAKGYGEIKREFIMKEDDNEFIVTSTIEKIIR